MAEASRDNSVPQTPLGQQIDQAIRHGGPMSVSTYMRLCLTHPEHGYYRRANPLGREGDFVTAPEISQMFGEMIGVFMALVRKQLAPETPCDIVELGPGRGTLMADALRTMTHLTKGCAPSRLFLLETSPALRAEQANRLSAFTPHWISEIAELDADGPPLIIIANEFFDALPIKQYQQANGHWHERVIGLHNGQRGWGLDPDPLPDTALPESVRAADDGAIWESGMVGADVMTELGSLIAKRGGALLAIDYGYETTQTGDTFQAVKNHAYADPLAEPGEADLTAHVDFEALASAAATAGIAAHPLLTQAQFLAALGIGERAQALAKANPDKTTALTTDLKRLTAPEQMGTLFKVLCVSHNGLRPYPFVSPDPQP